ncbi:DUF3592 domain-containing protein [Streptomyces sp. NPDC006422]|uniref:DUF3592 domain-containing protein n=1 Tax=unclassified Streptomyces TaxID=2593676 RepID=UPI0033BD5C3D
MLTLVAGLAVFGCGVREAVLQSRLQREGARAAGVVVRHHRSTGGREGGPVFYAVVEYADARGARHTFQAGSSGVKNLPVGRDVPVRYLPDVPRTARIDLAGRRIGEVMALLAGGALFAGVGIWLLVTGR